MEIRQQGVFGSFEINISKHRGYEFIFIFRKIPILINNYGFSSQILKIIFFFILKILRFISGFLIIFPETGDRFPVDSGAQHFPTIFFRVYRGTAAFRF